MQFIRQGAEIFDDHRDVLSDTIHPAAHPPWKHRCATPICILCHSPASQAARNLPVSPTDGENQPRKSRAAGSDYITTRKVHHRPPNKAMGKGSLGTEADELRLAVEGKGAGESSHG